MRGLNNGSASRNSRLGGAFLAWRDKKMGEKRLNSCLDSPARRKKKKKTTCPWEGEESKINNMYIIIKNIQTCTRECGVPAMPVFMHQCDPPTQVCISRQRTGSTTYIPRHPTPSATSLPSPSPPPKKPCHTTDPMA